MLTEPLDPTEPSPVVEPVRIKSLLTTITAIFYPFLKSVLFLTC